MKAEPSTAPPRAAHRGARVAILAVGAIGLAVVARTAAFYVHVDGTAFALTLLIGAGLSAGLVELLGRVRRVERTLAELTRLPRPATTAAIDAASPPLRTVLRARVAGVRATVPMVGFTSYLVGLLVMVGLLATFLGLVDALRGAREALGASSDIEALRGALTTPMLGLSRAFGTSAAGLSASAMLGLAAVVARRTELSLASAVHGYGDEALAPLTVAAQQLDLARRQQDVAARQLAVLEALVRQSTESAASTARSTEAVLVAAASVRTDVAAGVADLARAIEGALTPALDRAVARASDVTRERLAAWTEVVERDAAERRARDAALTAAWSAAQGEQLAATLAGLDQRLGATLTGLDQRIGATLSALDDRLEAHAEKHLARERAREDAIEARVSALVATEERALGGLERHVEAVDASLATHLERMTAVRHDEARASGDRIAALEATLRDHATALTATTGAVLAEAARRAEAGAAAAERVALAVGEELAARHTSEREALAAREASERAAAARSEAILADTSARTEAVLAALTSATEQIAARSGQVLDAQAERQAALEARWLAAHEASAARLAALLTEHAVGLEQGLTATRSVVDDAAGLLRASGVEMGAVAEVFTAAVDRYRDASAASLSALTGLDEAVDQAGKKAAIELLTDYLDQTREVFEHSLEVQRELYAELRALRARGASSAPEARVRA